MLNVVLDISYQRSLSFFPGADKVKCELEQGVET
jgi:hypothetical protein